jgi:hypothetical protein
VAYDVDGIRDAQHEEKYGMHDPQVCLDWPFLRAALRSKQWTAKGKQVLLQIFAGAIPSRVWAAARGFQIDPLCPCGHPGTVEHQLTSCTYHPAAGPLEASSMADLRKLIQWVPWPIPAYPEEEFIARVDGRPTDLHDFQLDPACLVYTDGSCKHVRDHQFAVARAAAVQVTSTGIRSLQAAVRLKAPRTAVYAEHLAMRLVHLGVHGTQVEVVTDCQAIVQGFHAAHDWQHDPGNRFAHFWAQVTSSIPVVHKVKAHCTPKEAEAVGQMHWFTGNATADEFANNALPTYEPGEVEACLGTQKVIHQHLREACQVLAGYEGFNPMGKQLRVAARIKVAAVPKARRVHQWQWSPRADAFVCRTCAATHRKTEVKGIRSACHGK